MITMLVAVRIRISPSLELSQSLISSELMKLQMWDLVAASHTPTVGSSLKLTDTYRTQKRIT